jgi:DNA-binding transcriptional LysR family regulator
MRLHLLKTFLAVARSRNITRAAAEVHLAQSSVSDQVQLLETELGADLFVRSKMGLETTPAGEALKPFAEEILALAEEARAAVAAAAGKAAGPLTIGALETIAAVKLPQWLSAFRSDHPDIDLRLKIAGSGDLLRKLEDGGIDIAFCFDKGDPGERFVKRAISAEPLVLVASPGERPAPIGESLNALAARRFVATGAGCIYRHLLEKAFAEAGIPAPRLAAEADSIRALARLVAAGTGLALVPRLAVADALERGELIERPWPGPVQAVSLIALWRRRRVQPPALKLLLAFIGNAAAPVRSADARPRHAGSSLS